MSDNDVRILIDDDGNATVGATKSDDAAAIERNNREAERFRAESEHYRRETAMYRQRIAQNQIGQALESARTESDSARAAYRDSMERGDYDGAAEAQERIARAAVQSQQIEQLYRQSQQPVDPVEGFCQTRTDTTAAWIRQHRDHFLDPNKRAKVEAAHFDAIQRDLEPDSPEYFEHVERKIGLRSEPKPSKRSGGGNVRQEGRNVVNLTRGEVEQATNGAIVWNASDVAARRCRPNQINEPVGAFEYARRKKAMQAAGYYERLD